VDGHTFVTKISTNGVDRARTCMRPLYSGASPNVSPNGPINNLGVFPQGLLGVNMTCGYLPYAQNPITGAKCPVTAGSRVQVWWDAQDDSHKGPCMVYLSKTSDGAGSTWFKIFEEGYNPSTSTWCTTRLTAGGYLDVTVPSDLSSGNYLMRLETIAHHESWQLHGSQPYVNCAEIVISGSGNANPTGNYLVSFPGAYKEDDPGILLSIYQSKPSYPIPGPAVYTAGSNGATSGAPQATTGTQQTTTGTQQTTTGTQQTTTGTQQTTTGTPGAPTSSQGSGNCDVNQCLTICGNANNIKSCSCSSGQLDVECVGAVGSAAQVFISVALISTLALMA